nr:PREDICTED: uncharacterized protein LOC102361414 [Latimeria chalumnae]XP_014342544.1 PREDICTED: uncharacterized protein LOC102361414 [Latimeria chalumnae]XP_014342545.1 PREDICTED: uncharacterized protein LOC102361414 [Latimeria chalumnae]|eukprot:XP_005993739.1 PREDICTED: uncharacterized protein LOC102361414 [Latimeria chalumnae]
MCFEERMCFEELPLLICNRTAKTASKQKKYKEIKNKREEARLPEHGETRKTTKQPRETAKKQRFMTSTLTVQTEELGPNEGVLLDELRKMRSSLEEKINKVASDTERTNSLVMELRTDFREIKNRMEFIEDRVSGAEVDINSLQKKGEVQEKENGKIWDKLLDLEARSLQNNIRIFGIPEGEETKTNKMEQSVQELLAKVIPSLHMEDLEIERAHRSLQS